MPKPASKTTRVILVCLCLLGLGIGLFWCGHRTQMAKQAQKAAAWEKDAARLVMINEGTCEWLVTIWPAGADDGKQWKMPVGQSAEAMLTAGTYRVEQKLLANVGDAQMRKFALTLEAGQVYRWRLINLLSSDAKEWAVSLDEEGRP
ncbi:MAG: hypothetical protein QM715_15490 [Nibricoccus sp.]